MYGLSGNARYATYRCGARRAAARCPFGTLFALCFLWFCISTPLVFVGSYFGYKKPAAEDPVRTNKIPRQIPDQVWKHSRPAVHCRRPHVAAGTVVDILPVMTLDLVLPMVTMCKVRLKMGAMVR